MVNSEITFSRPYGPRFGPELQGGEYLPQILHSLEICFVWKVVQLNISVSITVNRFSCILADGWRLMDAGQDGCPSNRLRTQPNGRTSPQGKQSFMQKKELSLRYRFLPYRDCCFTQCLMGAFLYNNLISSYFVGIVFADLQIAC